jgi:TRAP-type C4-dicarboxylate transport system substrate-binding protein
MRIARTILFFAAIAACLGVAAPVVSEAMWAKLSATEREHFGRAAREAATLAAK